MKNISPIHSIIMDFLLKQQQQIPGFYFATRERNTKKRLDLGYWFIGDDGYLQVSFWQGRDWKEKIYNIGLVVTLSGQCYIELAAQDSKEKAHILEEIVSEIGGFVRIGNKNKWQRHFEDTDYLSWLNKCIREIRPVIDKIVRGDPSGLIKPIDEATFGSKYIMAISLYNSTLSGEDKKKLARVCFNITGWKYPSGKEGKSTSKDAYENRQGFGHEEWLFDRSKVIDGYKYGFIKAFLLKTGKHFGSRYDLTLFTINSNGNKFLVAEIDDVICLTRQESEAIFDYYTKHGWIKEMQADVEKVSGTWKSKLTDNSMAFFNFKFRFENVRMWDLAQIADEDPNISTSRQVLLPLRTPLKLLNQVQGELSHASKKDKNTEPRVRIYDGECAVTYDPYHDKMQNALVRYLRDCGSYKRVYLEEKYVDIIAYTYTGECHYFEIKTHSPRLSIRHAIGQLMEYAYYPSDTRASQLIIVGEDIPDQDTLDYLNHLHGMFQWRIVYKAFDMSTMTFSDAY